MKIQRVKGINIINSIGELKDLDRYDYINSNKILIDKDIDLLLVDTYLRCYSYTFDSEFNKLDNNDMKALLTIIDELGIEVDLGYGRSSPAVELIDLYQFVDIIYNNNIKLSDYYFNWFIESWTDIVSILLFNDNEIIICN